MLTLDTTHPAYDFAMEVMCPLPPEPGRAPMKLLCADLGCDQGRLRKAFGVLKSKGIRINTYNGKGCYTAAISPQSWSRANMQGSAYLDQLTGATVTA